MKKADLSPRILFLRLLGDIYMPGAEVLRLTACACALKSKNYFQSISYCPLFRSPHSFLQIDREAVKIQPRHIKTLTIYLKILIQQLKRTN